MANFLDYRCPACGDEDSIAVVASIWVVLTLHGSDANIWGDQEYTPESAAQCGHCDYRGILKDFDPSFEEGRVS